MKLELAQTWSRLLTLALGMVLQLQKGRKAQSPLEERARTKEAEADAEEGEGRMEAAMAQAAEDRRESSKPQRSIGQRRRKEAAAHMHEASGGETDAASVADAWRKLLHRRVHWCAQLLQCRRLVCRV